MQGRTSHAITARTLGLGLAVLVHGLLAVAIVRTHPAFVLPEIVPMDVEMIDVVPPKLPEATKSAPVPEVRQAQAPKAEVKVVPTQESFVPEPAQKPDLEPEPKIVAPPVPALISAPVAAQAPTAKAGGDTSQAVTPKAYGGGDARKRALMLALQKREDCQRKRERGEVMAKDCPQVDVDVAQLPVKPRETRSVKLCLAERKKDWDRYRDGKGQYPGLRDLFKGKKDCLKE